MLIIECHHEGDGGGLAIGTELAAGSRAWRVSWRYAGSQSVCDLQGDVAYIHQALIRRRLTEDAVVNPQRGCPPRKLSNEQELEPGHICSHPGITLMQAQAWLQSEHDIGLTPAQWYAFARKAHRPDDAKVRVGRPCRK